MTQELQYSATLTGASFLYYEFKQVVSLAEQGLDESEMKVAVLTQNLFQYPLKSSIKRSLPSILRRVNVLDATLRRSVLTQSLESGKVINLYAIMKSDKLFFEFMNEVVSEKLDSGHNLLEKKDINLYLASKAEQNPSIAGWTELTINKLKQVYVRILQESGILKDKKTGVLSRLLMDEELKKHFIAIGDAAYVKAMGE